MSSVNNVKLNQSSYWKSKSCQLCKRHYPETFLNIEGHIHHGCDLLCLDTKACKRAARKLKASKCE